MNLKQGFPPYLTPIYKTFLQNGHSLYLVGGSVRNILLGRKAEDWDFTTDATPDKMQVMFPNAFYDNAFGTVGIPMHEGEKKHVVEITTFRTEQGHSDKRRPDQVAWGKTIDEDLMRRDFTINAMAIKISGAGDTPAMNFSEIIDPYHGQKDLDQKLVRAVGDPNSRFKEDALRILRAIRFATQLGFIIEENTWKALHQDAALLPAISAERIHDELLKILASSHPYEGVMLLKNAGLLEYILPELLEGIDISQVRPGRHHTEDVFTHNLSSLKHSPSQDSIVRFATLLHDIGKPKVRGADEQGLVTFYNHEIVGAQIAGTICERLRFSKKDREKIVGLIRWHMFSVDEHTTDAAIRRFIRRVGVENIRDMIDLRIADRLGSGTETAESWRLKLFKKRVEEQLTPAPFSINDLAVNGNDIMKTLVIKPSKQVGIILQKLFEEVDEDLSKNTKEYLTKRISEIGKN